ncbi:type I secretion system permease/ATPase [Pusillimonas sp. SM2304]|uniref:type I secretion system permease/ATPase n=1 Tax=Pusillimonas sp. SM2304 TaxID=3073241 RepID=UPI0028765C34|nr:type I secretion system permease/ATPase [Pusillimonas sp. SM2304]MDS1139638.1 type I secretion system permease/ATPase [Pusillimonas sp. SM2304]
MQAVHDPQNQSHPPHLVHDDPLLACMVALTKIHGHPCSAQALSGGLPLVNDRLTLALLPRAAARAHCSARLLRRQLNNLPDALLPAILILKGERACLLLEARAGTYVVQYPEVDTPVEVVADVLNADYTGLAYFVKPLFRFEPRARDTPQARSKHWFWAVVFENWRLYRDALLAAVLINIFALVMPLYTMNVYDRVVPNNAIETLWVLTAGIAIAMVFNLVLTSVRSYVIDTASKRVDVKLSARIMEQVLDLRMEARPASVGSFAANLRSFESVRDFIASASLTTLVDLPFVLLFLAVMAWISPWMIIPPIVAIVVVLVVSFVAQARMSALVVETFQASAQRNAGLVESLAGLETVKTLNAQGTAQRKWESATEFLARLGARIKLISAVTVGFVQTAQQLVTISVIVIGTFLIQDAALSLGGIIASSMIAGRCLAPLGQVAGLMMQYQNARISLASIDNYMGMPVERPIERNFVPRPFLKGAIELRNVSFQYPGSAQGALDKVNLKFAPGEKVGIIGRIGSGKSTLEKLILGLYEPTAGAVLVDGIDIKQIDPADLRRAIGYVPQDPVLFYGSLKYNLTLGAPFAEDSRMLNAARVAGIEEFAARHPDGYDMMIGERGESLSGGQRQSVAVGRALINDPPILLMDEPSSNMDNQSEALLKRRLKAISTDKTLVLITHRTALLELVDRLIVVDNGHVVADGPKDQVVEALRQGRIGRSREAA